MTIASSILLTLLGVAAVILAVVRDRAAPRIALHPPLLVPASIAIFAFAVRPLGLVAATIIAVIVVNVSDLRTRIGEGLVAVILGVAVVVAAVTVGDLPVHLWPRLGGP